MSSRGWRMFLGAAAIAAAVSGAPAPATAERGFLGMHLQGIDATIAATLGLSQITGVLVRDLTLDGPAGVAGFKRGDLIVEFAGVKIDTFERLVQVAQKAQAGDKVNVKVLRIGKEVNLAMSFGTWPQTWLVNQSAFAAIPELGLTFASLTAKVRERLGIRWGSTGIVLTKIEDAVSNKMALRRGDIVQQVNQQPIWMPEQLVDAYQKAKADKSANLLLLIERSDGFQFILLPVPPGK